MSVSFLPDGGGVSPFCYCGCHEEGEHRLALDTDPNNGYPICRECAECALDEGGEIICSRDSRYAVGWAGWTYFTADEFLSPEGGHSDDQEA